MSALVNHVENDMQDLKIKFDGQTHQIEANTLINSLLHFTTIVQEVNKELKTDKKIEVKVNALPEGSFLVHFTVESLNIIDKVQKIFSNPSDSAAANIITIVTGVYATAKFLSGRKPEIIKSNDKETSIKNQKGEILVLNSTTINIYISNKIIKESLSQEFATLENDPNVTGFELLDKNDNPIVQITRAEFAALSNDTQYLDEITDKITNKNVMLNIVRLPFDKNQKWEFYYEGNKISAKINDGEFIKIIDNGESFAKGDSLEAELEIRQEFDKSVNTFINKSYSIVKIIRHVPRPAQSKLDFS